MIGSLHQVKVGTNLPLGCVSKYKHTRSGNARGALLSLLILAFACLGCVKANAQNWTGSTVTEANGKTVYLWNVGAKKFLGKGGRWGTEAVISNVGTPFILKTSDSKFYLTSLAKAEGGSSNGCLEFMNGVNSTHDAGNFFVDRQLISVSASAYPTFFYSFTGSQTAYQFQVTSSEGSSSDYIGTFYLVADPTTGKAKGEASIADGSEDYSKWIIVTLDERKEYFKAAEASETSAVPGTFLMDDQDFARNDMSVSSWQTKSSSSATTFDDTLSNSSEYKLPSYAYSSTKFYKHTYTGTCTYKYWNSSYTHNVTYTITNTIPGEQQKENNPTLTAACGGYSSRNHNSTDVTVTYASTEEVENPGYTYYVGNGYGESNKITTDEDGNELETESNEQEIYGGDWTANIHGSYGVVNQTISSDNMIREGWYKVSCVGFTTATTGTVQLYASAGTASTVGKEYAVQPLNKIAASEQPATYVKASRLINGGGYDASVMVYVGKEGEAFKTLSFGIYVDGADDTAWTCFDNFQIEYFGNPEANLVLDEDQTNIKYINDQRYVKNPNGGKDEYQKQRTLYLHRTLNAGKWNSIVLPVTLTVSQVKSAFGDGVRISEFKGAIDPDHKGRIIFQKINADRNNGSDIAIEAGKLYLIKPDESAKMNSNDGDVASSAGNITVKEYYTIPQVQFYPQKELVAKVEGEKGKETYDGNVNVQFVGTYVSDNKGGSIPANSYVISGKDTENSVAGLWYYRTKPTNTKGFRGWLQPVGDNSSAKQLEYSFDGIVGTADYTTGIQGIVDDINAKESNIYNLNGQLVRANAASRDGLAKGVYIQNGKKFIVK